MHGGYYLRLGVGFYPDLHLLSPEFAFPQTFSKKLSLNNGYFHLCGTKCVTKIYCYNNIIIIIDFIVAHAMGYDIIINVGLRSGLCEHTRIPSKEKKMKYFLTRARNYFRKIILSRASWTIRFVGTFCMQ